MQILVLESSTTSAKGLLYSDRQGVLKVTTEAYLPQYSDIQTQDAEGIFQQTAAVGRSLAEQYGVDMIALGGTWHSILACDRSFHPVTRTYSWPYTGASPVAQELRKDSAFVDRFYHTTGCMVHGTYPVFKLLHLRRQGLDLQDLLFMGQGTYNFYRLTGQFLLSESMASGSGFLDIRERKLSREVLGFLGIRTDQFGALADYREIRPLSEEGARLLGLKSGIPVLTAHPDGALNQVGAGALGDGVMTLSIGTSAALRLSTSRPIIPGEPSTWCYLSPSGWLSGAATAGACNCVDWVKNRLFPSGTTYREIESNRVETAELPVYLPFLYGERCPGWRDDRKAAFFGVNDRHSAVDLYFSAMEGVLYNVFQCYEVLCGINGFPRTVKLSGGILHSGIWTQMCCDIFNQQMECSNQDQMSLIGGAVLALELGGAIGDIRDFRSERGAVVSPDPEKGELYTRRYEQYRELYEKTK